MEVKKTFKLIWEYFKINIQSAMEYRVSFITQAAFMFLNDVMWIVFWIIMFNKFPSINTWGFTEVIFMYIVITASWGLAGMFFGNFTKLADIIKEGQLDFYLALPQEELTHALISRSKFQAVGDFLFGVVLAIIFLPVAKVPLLMVLIILSSIMIIAFAVALASLSFYIGSATELANHGLMTILVLATYPFTIFQGYTRFILLAIIPVGFITGVPVQLLNAFSWKWFALLILFAVVLTAVALLLFKKGIKRYESGNLINVRV